MFPRFGDGPDETLIRRVRLPGSEACSFAHASEEGLLIRRTDLMITSDMLTRFEDRHSVFRRSNTGPASKYDWEAAYLAMMVRIHDQGLPESLTELVAEMQDLFIRNSAHGDAPDESTIRKRISPTWHQLRAPAPA